MNTNSRRTLYGGIALIVLGIFALTGLWWMLPVLALAGGGAFMYVTRRRMGQLYEALVGGMWGIGLALTWLTGAWVAGLLLLGGATLLLRGREQRVDAVVGRLLGQAQAMVPARRSTTSAPIVRSQPANTQSQGVTIVTDEHATTGETTRLHS
jgi:hypothetical protein